MLKVAIANLKGGVGKSTTTVLLSETLALFHGRRVLIIDLDAQSNTSFMILSRGGVEAAENQGKTLPNFIHDLGNKNAHNLPLHRYVIPRASELLELRNPGQTGRVDLIPSVPNLWFVELLRDKHHYMQNQEPAQEMRDIFTRHLEVLRPEYDVVFFDCPPGFSSLTRAGLLAADVVVSPTIADAVSVRSLADFKTLGLGSALNQGHIPHYVTVSKFQANQTNQRELELLKAGYDVLLPPIRYSVDMTRATERIRSDSYRSFAEKYGLVRSDVRALGDTFYRHVIKQHGLQQ